jgi:hypothetical protein
MLLYILNDHFKEEFGGQYLTTNGPNMIRGLAMACDYVIKFDQGQPPFYVKNRFVFNDPFSEKELAFMILRSKHFVPTYQ